MHIPIDNKNVSSNIWYPFWLKKNPMNKIVIDEWFLKMKKIHISFQRPKAIQWNTELH